MTTTQPNLNAPVVSFVDQWEEWHASHEANRASSHGFLAVTGLYWLEAAPQSIPNLLGEWWTDASGVHIRLQPGAGSLRSSGIDGEPGVALEGIVDLGVIPERGGVTLWAGDVAIEVAKRGGRDLVRPRDPHAPFLTRYAGTPTFTPDPTWALTGRFEAFATPRPTTVGAVADGLEHVYEAPGVVAFEHPVTGERHQLTAFPGGADESLLLLFTDATSGATTYGANRSIAVPAPGPDGEVTLDFNRATNLPCAYTDHATCPLPPSENRLPFAVEAGEKVPTHRVGVDR